MNNLLRLISLIICSALFGITNTFAQSANQENSKIEKNGFVNGDILFFPEAGEFLLEAGFGGSSGSLDAKTVAATLATIDSSSSLIPVGVRFGITDQFTIGVLGNYVLSSENKTTTTSTGQTSTTKSNGFSDFTFSGQFRVSGESYNDFIFDVIGQFSPGIMPSNSASSSGNGDAGRGGNYAAFGTRIGYQTAKVGFTLAADISHFFETDQTESGTNVQVKTDAATSFQIGPRVQFTPNELLDLNLGLNLSFLPGSTVTRSNSSSKITTTSNIAFNANGSIGLRIIPDRLRLEAGLGFTFPQSYELTNSNGTFDIEAGTTTNYAAAISFLF